jgi:hypothetical protein
MVENYPKWFSNPSHLEKMIISFAFLLCKGDAKVKSPGMGHLKRREMQ